MKTIITIVPKIKPEEFIGGKVISVECFRQVMVGTYTEKDLQEMLESEAPRVAFGKGLDPDRQYVTMPLSTGEGWYFETVEEDELEFVRKCEVDGPSDRAIHVSRDEINIPDYRKFVLLLHQESDKVNHDQMKTALANVVSAQEVVDYFIPRDIHELGDSPSVPDGIELRLTADYEIRL